MEFTEEFIKGKSFIRPEQDSDSIRYFLGTDQQNIGIALSHVPHDRNRLCIQAGGNLGYFPNEFADFFDRVITFEPDPNNFHCLIHNCTADNIIKIQAALGFEKQWIEIEVPDVRHVGLNQVKIGGAALIPVLRIDDFEYPFCDFIQLDLEGYEYYALQGAEQTIKKFKPVLCIELCGHSETYGFSLDQTRDLIHSWGYQKVDHIYNDQIFIYGG